MVRMTRKQQIERFWSRVDKSGGPQACWPASWARGDDGYPLYQYRWRGRLITSKAHRVAWIYTHRKLLPRNLLVCHTCDNRACCNLNHLFLGSPADNLRDAAAKGRMNRGEARYNAKMTEAKVRKVRSLYATGTINMKELAAQFGVVTTAIFNIIHRNRWKHVA